MSTLKDIALILTAIGSFVGLMTLVLRWQNKKLDEKLKPIFNEIKKIKINKCKNYLVDFLDDVEKGVEMSSERISRGYEAYEEYTNELHQNHYVKKKWLRLEKAGLLSPIDEAELER